MQEYVEDAINLAISEGGAVYNRKLKEQVSETQGDVSNGRWHIVDAPLKDEPLSEDGGVDGEGHAFVPYGKHWYYDPPITILIGWILATLGRHENEVIRCCKAISLNRYRRAPEAAEVREHLEALREAINEAIDGIDHAKRSGVQRQIRKRKKIRQMSA